MKQTKKKGIKGKEFITKLDSVVAWLRVDQGYESPAAFVTFGPPDQIAYHMRAEYSI